MIKRQASKQSSSPKNSKINKNLTVPHSNNEQGRVYQRIFKNSRFQRRVFIPLKDLGLLSSDRQMKKHQQIAEEESKYAKEYNLQFGIKSDFVIRNLQQTVQKKSVIWIQQDFSCFLSQFYVQKLNFMQRFEIFYSIARGVKDLTDNLVCHRSLCPSKISIIKAGEGAVLAKINCFQTAIAMEDIKSLQYDMHLKHNSFSAPEIVQNRLHGFAADIYSLGFLLNYILYDTIENIWEDNQQTKIEVPDGTPIWLLQLLKSMIHYSPSKRYPIGTILDICKSSFKCMDILGKYIKVGKKNLPLRKVSTEISLQIDG